MGIFNKIIKRLSCKNSDNRISILSEDLRKMYIESKACDDWMDNWGNPDMDTLLKRFIDPVGLKFSIEHDIPSVSFLDKNIKGHGEKYGIYINDDHVLSRNEPIVVLNGHSFGDIIIDNPNKAVYEIHVRHSSIVNIKATNGAYVWVKVYGSNAHITCDVRDNSQIIVFHMNKKRKDKKENTDVKTYWETVNFKKVITSKDDKYML